MTPSLWGLRALLVSGFFATLTALGYALASAPLGAPNQLGLRGLRRVRTLQQNAFFGVLEPLLRWLGIRLRTLLPQSLHQRIDRQLTLSGDFWGLLSEELVALTLCAGAAGAGMGAIYGTLLNRGSLYVLLGGMVGIMLPYLQVTGLEQDRRKHIQNGLPYVIDLLALGLSAGLDFPGALRQVVDKSSNKDDPLIEEIGLILQELSVGKTRREALLGFALRAPSDSVREFVAAIVQAEERGNPLGNVLEIQAEGLRQRRSTRAEEAAARASVKMLGPMVLLFGAILMMIVVPMFLKIRGNLMSD